MALLLRSLQMLDPGLQLQRQQFFDRPQRSGIAIKATGLLNQLRSILGGGADLRLPVASHRNRLEFTVVVKAQRDGRPR